VDAAHGGGRYPDAVLRSLTRWRAAAARLPVVLVDGVIAAALFGGTVAAGQSWTGPGRHQFDLRGVLLSAAVLLPLAFRRRWPLPVLALTCLTYVAYLSGRYVTSLDFYGPLLAFATVAMRHRTITTAYTCVPVAVLMFANGIRAPGAPLVGSLFQAVLAPALAWGFGASIRGLSVRNDRLADLTRQLEGAQEQIAQRAAVEERVRIARELHDAAAHHMSVIGVQAELAAYVFDSDPRQARASLGAIAQASREALAEMRSLLTVLRPSPGTRFDPELEYTPALGLHRLAGLADRVRAAGVTVDVRVLGERGQLSSSTDACAYRIVQEALTNVAKHAPGARARVTVEFGPEQLRIEVVNSAGDAAAAPATTTAAATARAPAALIAPAAAETIRSGGAGYGLVGMRERAAVCGGTLEAGARPDGGYAVVLILPSNIDVDAPERAHLSSGP
jgi:signal transduction histidine kinase